MAAHHGPTEEVQEVIEDTASSFMDYLQAATALAQDPDNGELKAKEQEALAKFTEEMETVGQALMAFLEPVMEQLKAFADGPQFKELMDKIKELGDKPPA
jgi:TRAP-type C4-dicarboxylate transport system substrate-binding protein